MKNQRFTEYTTSGAFTLNLSRNQVHALSMSHGGSGFISGTGESALERKGLVETVPAPDAFQDDRVEFRPTLAGLLTLGLLREAGLTNGPADAVADEIVAMREELKRLRIENGDLRRKAQAAMARKARAEEAFMHANAFRNRRKPMIRVLTPRDPIPHVADADLVSA